ncbi:MAG TPA: hypothetical protein VIH64_08415, partial [Streptosporangiaceae bacterium]
MLVGEAVGFFVGFFVVLIVDGKILGDGLTVLPTPTPLLRVGAALVLPTGTRDCVSVGRGFAGALMLEAGAEELAGLALPALSSGRLDSRIAATVPPIAATATLTPAASSADRRRRPRLPLPPWLVWAGGRAGGVAAAARPMSAR